MLNGLECPHSRSACLPGIVSPHSMLSIDTICTCTVMSESRVDLQAVISSHCQHFCSSLLSYESLLTQFSAVSYGDPLFSCYILLPLQRRFPVGLRHLVWDNHSHTLRLLSLPLDQVQLLTPLLNSKLYFQNCIFNLSCQ